MKIIPRRALQGAGAGAAAGLLSGFVNDDGQRNSGMGHYARNILGGAAIGGAGGAAYGVSQRPAIMARQRARRLQTAVQSAPAREAVNTAATAGFRFPQMQSAARAPASVEQRAVSVARAARQPQVHPNYSGSAPARGEALNVRQGGAYAAAPGTGQRAWAGRAGAPATAAQAPAPNPSVGRPPAPPGPPVAQRGPAPPQPPAPVRGAPRGLKGLAAVAPRPVPVRAPSPLDDLLSADAVRYGRPVLASYGKQAALSLFMNKFASRFAMKPPSSTGVEALPEVGNYVAKLIENAGDMPAPKITPPGGFSAVSSMAAKAKQLRVPGITPTTPLRDAYAVLNRLRGVKP